jgi:hypothetical protein
MPAQLQLVRELQEARATRVFHPVRLILRTMGTEVDLEIKVFPMISRDEGLRNFRCQNMITRAREKSSLKSVSTDQER